jgi:hypothetical protein
VLLPARPRDGEHEAPPQLLARDMSGAAAGALIIDAIRGRKAKR